MLRAKLRTMLKTKLRTMRSATSISQIQGNRSPVILGYSLDDIAQALVLADGDGEADIHLAADRYLAISVEAAVGPHGELTRGSGVAHRPTVFRRK